MRDRQVLKLIEYFDVNSEGTGQKIADYLGISLSTFKRELSKMSREFADNGFSLSGKSGHGNGYHLEITDSFRFQEYMDRLGKGENTGSEADLNDTESRIRLLVSEFLALDEEYIRMEELSDDLLLSRAQLARDIQTVRAFFHLWNIEIISRPHYGSALKYEEKDFRACAAALTLNEIHLDEEGKIYLLPFENSPEEAQLDEIQNVLVKLCTRKTYDLNDITARDLAAHFLICVQRMKGGHSVSFDSDVRTELLNDPERGLAERIAAQLSALYGIGFSEDELCYVIMHLSAKQMAHRSMISDEIRSLTDEMLEEVWKRHQLDLRDDTDLRKFLGLHTVSLLKRLKYGIILTNPYLWDIRSTYIASYDIALSAVQVIAKHYQCRISEDETAYYALHFRIAAERARRKQKKNVLIVCSSGRGTAKMLDYNIHSWFDSRLNRVDTCNKFELDERDLTQYDCVFTTVPLKQAVPVPVFMINAFFDSTNMRIIENALDRNNVREDGTLYFREDMFFADIAASTPAEAIHVLCERVRDIHPLAEGFEESILERERIQDTQMGNIAFPRTHGIISAEPVIVFAILDHPIRWKKDTIQVIVLTSCPADFYKENQLFYSFIRELSMRKHYIRALIRSRSYETLLDIFGEFIRKGNMQ